MALVNEVSKIFVYEKGITSIASFLDGSKILSVIVSLSKLENCSLINTSAGLTRMLETNNIISSISLPCFEAEKHKEHPRDP